MGETEETSFVKSHALTIHRTQTLECLSSRNTSCREGIMSPVPGVGDSREVTQQKHAALQASIALQRRFQAAAVRPLRMEDWARAFARGKKKLSRFSAPSTPDLLHPRVRGRSSPFGPRQEQHHLGQLSCSLPSCRLSTAMRGWCRWQAEPKV